MRRNSLVAVVLGMLVAFFSSSIIYAGTSAKEVMKMNDPSYKVHKKGIVEFTHKKHARVYKIACGECHHDDKGKPLALKKGDDVKRCIECHQKPGPNPKGKNAPKLTEKEKLQYHAVALHHTCKGCHKKYNKKNNTDAAPTACNQCHPKS